MAISSCLCCPAIPPGYWRHCSSARCKDPPFFFCSTTYNMSFSSFFGSLSCSIPIEVNCNYHFTPDVVWWSYVEMSQLSFTHLLNLSFAFHTRRKTGEILRILDRGAAINQTFEILLFNIIPTFFDIVIALVMFSFIFEWLLSFVIFVVMFAYSKWFRSLNLYALAHCHLP